MDNMEQKHAPIACDPSSQTNIRFLVASHTIVNLTIDFSSRTLHGNVIHKFVPAADCKADKHQQQPDYLILDTSYLDISYVRVGGQEATWELLPRVEPLGSALRIQLGQGVCAEGSEVVVEVCIAQLLLGLYSPSRYFLVGRFMLTESSYGLRLGRGPRRSLLRCSS